MKHTIIETLNEELKDDMHVLKFLLYRVHGLRPVSGSAAELAVEEYDYDS